MPRKKVTKEHYISLKRESQKKKKRKGEELTESMNELDQNVDLE